MIDLLIQLRSFAILTGSRVLGLRSSSTVKDTSVTFLGNISFSVFSMVFTILAARFLGPSGWGVVAAVWSLAVILSAFGDLGLGASLFRFASSKRSNGQFSQARKIFRVVFALRLVTAITLFLILLAVSPWVAQFILKSNDYILVAFAALGLLGILLIDFQIVSMQARQSWKLAALTVALSGALRVLLLLFLFLQQSISIYSVLLLYTGTHVIVWAISLFWQRTLPSFEDGWEIVTKRIVKFSGWMGGNRVASAINSRVHTILLVSLVGTFEAGIYSAASQVSIGVPIVIGSFAAVLAPRFATLKGKELSSFFKKSFGLSALISIGLVVGIFVVPLVIYLFGPEYERSGPVLQWLLVTFVPFALAVPAVNILIYHFEKPKIITILSFTQLPFIFVINFLLIPKIGVFAPVVTVGAINTSTLIITYFFALKYLARR